MAVTLEQLYKGATKKLSVQKKALCKKCEGRGTISKKGADKCGTCRGSGKVIRVQNLGNRIIQQIQTMCSECQGQGEFIDPKDRCKTCEGKKIIREKKIIEVIIDRGMEDGQKITFHGEGDAEPGPDASPGDMIVVLDEQEHPVFKRPRTGGEDLLISMEITLSEALCGLRRSIKTLDDRILVITTIPGEVVKHGAIKCIMGEGMPRYRDPYEKGRLIIQFNVQFPENLDATIVPELEKFLPPRPPLDLEGGEQSEDVALMDLDFDRETHMRGDRRQYDEDDGPNANGMPGMQCATH